MEHFSLDVNNTQCKCVYVCGFAVGSVYVYVMVLYVHVALIYIFLLSLYEYFICVNILWIHDLYVLCLWRF